MVTLWGQYWHGLKDSLIESFINIFLRKGSVYLKIACYVIESLEGTGIFFIDIFFVRFNWSFNRCNMFNAYFILLEFKLGKIRWTTDMRSGYITIRIHKFKINSKSYTTTSRSSCNNDRKFTTMVTGVSQSLVCSQSAFLQSQQRKP